MTEPSEEYLGLAAEWKTRTLEAAYQDLIGDVEERDAKLVDLEAALAAMRGALEPFASGGMWGTWKAFLVHGPATKEEGIQAARQITAWQVAVDAALAASPGAATRDTERVIVLAEVGECCRGADPLCAGGCLVERALRKRVPTGAADVVQALCEHSSDYHATHAYRYGPDQAKCPDAICVSDRALLARPEVKELGG